MADHHPLAITDLVVRYYGRKDDALRGISLEAEAGTFTTIAGRNGAGKSTLALAAAGLLPRVIRAMVSGRIEIAGEVILDEAPGAPGAAPKPASSGNARSSARAGIVFPNPGNQLSGTKTSVREELAFGLENLGIPRDQMDGRIDRVLSDLQIEHLADRPPYALSGGEQQRVAIASIVAMELPLLVLDEPTAQLDPLATMTVAQLLERIASEGVAVLAAEHAPEVLGRSSRTLVLADGRAVTLDIPGRALAPEVLRDTGAESPTVVALASAAGIPPEQAFDEQAIAIGLRSAARTRTLASLPPVGAATQIDWEPVRSQPSTGIEIRGLVHRYPGGVEALRGVDLSIEPGTSVAIVGQNGSGKTTLVKHLNGLLRPTSGSVRIGELDVASVPVHRAAATVGFVFQDPDDQLFSRTVSRELQFGPRNLRLSDDATRALVAAALRAIGLEAERDVNPYDLNVSARKLIALGSVLATDPAILVLDEPTTGQDAPGLERVGGIVDAFHAAGRTVVAISHDMEFAARHFGRIVVMRHGEVVADDEPGAIFAPERAELLASTGLTPPPTARIAARLGIREVPAGWRELLALIESA